MYFPDEVLILNFFIVVFGNNKFRKIVQNTSIKTRVRIKKSIKNKNHNSKLEYKSRMGNVRRKHLKFPVEGNFF